MAPALAGGYYCDMIYLVEFYKGDQRCQLKKTDLGLDAAKQHALVMAQPFGATSARILDKKRKVVASYDFPALG